MIPDIGATELIIFLVVVVLLFGAKRVPALAHSLGRGLKEFKKGTTVDAHEEEIVSPNLSSKERSREPPAKQKPNPEKSIRA